MSKTFDCTLILEIKTYLFWRCVMSELFASIMYSFFTSTLIFNLHTNVNKELFQVHFLCTAIGIGFVVASISYGFHVTHNTYIFPAITIGQCLIRNCSFLKSICYFVVQMIGGIAGVAIEHAMSNRDKFVVRSPVLTVTHYKGCIFEGIFAFMFVLVVLKSYHQKNNINQSGEAIIYGMAVCASFLVGNQYTGGVQNTSLVFGIGVVHNHWPSFIWIYWVGPLTGGLVAGFVQILLLFHPSNEELTLAKRSVGEKSFTRKKECVKLNYVDASCTSSYNNPAFVDLLSETKKSDEQRSKKHSTSFA